MLRAVVRGSRLCPALLRAPFSAAAASPIPAPNPRPDIAYNKVGPRWEPGAAGLGRGVRGSRVRPWSPEHSGIWARSLGKEQPWVQPRGTARVSHGQRALSPSPQWVQRSRTT